MRPGPARSAVAALTAMLVSASGAGTRAAWEPTRPVEIIVPSGTGGGADTMARVIQAIVDKHKLANQPFVVSNKLSGGGSEGFLDLKNARGNPHKLLLALSNVFTTPLTTSAAFSWRDFTPVAMLALDGFALWVPKDAPWATTRDFLEAARAAPAAKRLKLGGTGLSQEDRLLASAIEKASGASFEYVPYRGGGEVALQLAARRLDASVNNPIEAVDQWHTGMVRPLCLFDKEPLGSAAQAHVDPEWKEVPTCNAQGLPIVYRMLRGLFMAPDVGADKVEYYLALLEHVRGTPEWQSFLAKGVLDDTFMTGDAFAGWLEKEERRHGDLLRDAGLLRPAE